MSYLVKSLVEAVGPIRPGLDAKWQIDEIREVDDAFYSFYKNNPAAFTVLSGPGAAANVTALQAQDTTAGAGTVNGATVTAAEYGKGAVHRTVLTLAATPMTLRDTEQGGGVKVYDFPLGKIIILDAAAAIVPTTHSAILTTLNGGVTGNFGVGTTTQANATVATTEQDIVSVAAFTSSTVIDVAPAEATGTGGYSTHDGSATAIDAFLNLAVAGAEDIDANASLLVSGTIEFTWINLAELA
jgi:hypothetical protein